jgi:hypothetical protein
VIVAVMGGRLRRRWSVGAEDPWGVPDADPKEEIKEREGKEERALAGEEGGERRA